MTIKRLLIYLLTLTLTVVVISCGTSKEDANNLNNSNISSVKDVDKPNNIDDQIIADADLIENEKTTHLVDAKKPNEKVYFGVDDRYLVCFDAATGVKLWTYGIGTDVIFPANILNNKLYFKSRDDEEEFINCIDLSKGEKIWSYRTRRTNNNVTQSIISSSIISEEKMYFVVSSHSNDGQLKSRIVCLNTQSGKILWDDNLNAYSTALNTAYGKLFIANKDFMKITCLDDSTGKMLWKTNNGVSGSEIFIYNFKIYFEETAVGMNGNLGRIVCLSTLTGNIVWEKEIIGPCHITNICNDKVYYYINNESHAEENYILDNEPSKIICANALTGVKIWEQMVVGKYFSRFISNDGLSKPFNSNNKYYVCTYPNFDERETSIPPQKTTFISLNAQTGEYFYQKEITGCYGLANVSDGIAYFYSCLRGSDDSSDKSKVTIQLQGYDSKTGEKIWEYKADNCIYKDIIVSNGKVFIILEDGKLICLDGKTGKLLWESK